MCCVFFVCPEPVAPVSEVRFVSDLTEVDLKRELDPDNVGPPLVIPAQANDSRWSKLGQKLANLDDPEALAKERAAKAQAAALQLNRMSMNCCV